MSAENNHYPDFTYEASQLSAFVFSVGTFIISLKNGKMTNFSPPDTTSFRDWLHKHQVRDISVDDGISKLNSTHSLQKKNKRK